MYLCIYASMRLCFYVDMRVCICAFACVCKRLVISNISIGASHCYIFKYHVAHAQTHISTTRSTRKLSLKHIFPFAAHFLLGMEQYSFARFGPELVVGEFHRFQLLFWITHLWRCRNTCRLLFCIIFGFGHRRPNISSRFLVFPFAFQYFEARRDISIRFPILKKKN